jgi:hypothetical protein
MIRTMGISYCYYRICLSRLSNMKNTAPVLEEVLNESLKVIMVRLLNIHSLLRLAK